MEDRSQPHTSSLDLSVSSSLPTPAIRLGLRMVKGLRRADADVITDTITQHGQFDSIATLWKSSGVSAKVLKRLADADAYGSMGLDRQQALWQVRDLHDVDMPLFDGVTVHEHEAIALPLLPDAAKVLHDYATVGLTLKQHPMQFLRKQLDRRGAVPNRALLDESQTPTNRIARVAGIVLVRQRPSTASGVVFMTLEDETGIANLILWPKVYRRYRKVARHSTILLASGKVQRDSDGGNVVHVLVQHLQALEMPGQTLAAKARNFH